MTDYTLHCGDCVEYMATMVAAIKHGRRFIGCDLSERWVNRTRQRIEAEARTMQPTLLEVD